MSDIACEQIRFSVAACITTMHRPVILEACLTALTACDPSPNAIIVSDDSKDPSMITATMAVVARFPGVVYVRGPSRGVCANRNNALNQVLNDDVDYVTFLDDDTHTPPDFFQVASTYYQSLRPVDRKKTIITGAREGDPNGPVRLNFRGYFESAEVPESVTVASSIFPMAIMKVTRWDEHIFFGSEDAELCLRALAQGFTIHFVPRLHTSDLAAARGVLMAEQVGSMSKYEMYCEAARLYIGVKRYAQITPHFGKLVAFFAIYFAHMFLTLLKRRMPGQLFRIVRVANLRSLFGPASTTPTAKTIADVTPGA